MARLPGMTPTPRRRYTVNRRQALSTAAVVTGGGGLLAACGSDEGTDPGADPSSSEPDSSGSDDAGSGRRSDEVIASTGDVPEGSGLILEEPQVVITQPEAGEFKAFSSICTHQGCPVTEIGETIDCTCHGSKFSLTDGAPTEGPATSALEEQPITVKGEDITLG